MPTWSRTPRTVRVVARRVRLPLEGGAARAHWAMDSPCISHFWNVLSCSFPHVERFFIDAARPFVHAVGDEKLRREVAAFIGQEGHHAQQHRRFNAVLREAGLDTARYERWFAGVLTALNRVFGPTSRLALTAAFEHLASVFAAHYLRHTLPSRETPREIDALWRWHAAEEIEHKSVTFDLYRAVQGGYGQRVVAMFGVFPVLTLLVLAAHVDLVRRDVGLPERADAVQALGYLFGRSGIVRTAFLAAVRYAGPRFHPWDVDDSALIEQSREHYARYVNAAREAGRPVSG
jgi:hypothetical protein